MVSNPASTFGSSPLTRGTLLQRMVLPGAIRFIPAYAGNSPLRHFAIISPAVHPRLRGELFISPHTARHDAGSSPLTRGTLSEPPPSVPPFAVHPRLRGELVYLNVMAGVPNGSSPLTRGTHDLSDAIAIFGRFIPAYAGNSAFLSVLASVNAVHPRLRGELRLVRGPLRWSNGSSPLTRGTPLRKPTII